MQKQKFLSSAFIFSVLLSGLSAWAGMQQQSVPLPDDDPARKVAAPEQKPREAPATVARSGADSGAAAPENDGGWKQTTKVSGVKIDFRGVPSLKDVLIKRGPVPVSLNELGSSEMVEGQPAVLQFRFTDAAGAPMTGLRVAAWMDQAVGEKPADARMCHSKIQSFLQMQLSARPEVDLNTYYVLVLTQEPSVLVVDPRIGFGSSKLYTAIDLAAPGTDWIMGHSGDRLFISMPSLNQIAVIDTMTFKVLGNIDAGEKPNRMSLQPDGKYLWVGNDALEKPATSGVTVIDTATLRVAARIPTGRGHHEIAFDENQNVYVTNQEDGTVSIISAQKLSKLQDVPGGKQPVALAYSSRSKNIYVASRGDGKISVISAEDRKLTGALASKPGLTALKITPDGRWGFVANGTENNVLLLDVSSNKFVQQYEVGSFPDQLAFTDSYLYVRSRESEHVTLIPLSDVGSTSQTAEFPAGQVAPGALADVLASPVAPSLDGASAFVANPADRRVYYYQEGMAAPMGSIEGYGKTPKAAMVLDRSIHETAPGIYSVGLRLPKPGLYDVPLFLDSPAMSYCFDYTVQVNPLLKKGKLDPVYLRAVKNNLQVKPGEPAQLQFTLIDPETMKPRTGIKDVEVTVLLAEGLRQMRFSADPVGDGLYQFTFTPPQEGVYYAMVKIPSLKVKANQLPYLMIRASEAPTSDAKLTDQSNSDQPRKQ
jgi:YVTN family beta-propeller protein